jgi:hypothetical protein
MACDQQTERILLTGTAPDGDRIDLVAFGDDSCGIMRNGAPLPDRRWTPCQIDDSTLALMRALGLE